MINIRAKKPKKLILKLHVHSFRLKNLSNKLIKIKKELNFIKNKKKIDSDRSILKN
jgi:hypothetical protein